MLSTRLKSIFRRSVKNGNLSEASQTIEPSGSNLHQREVKGYDLPVSIQEDLPPELKNQILLDISDLQTLNVIVHASPSYHQVYASQREHILSTVLERELEGAVLADVLTTVRACKLMAGKGRITNVKDFLAEYRTSIYSKRVGSSPTIAPDEASEVARLHTIIGSIALRFYHFTHAARAHLQNAPPTDPDSPSKTELRRIYRALYRFELFCTLFCPPIHCDYLKPIDRENEADGRDMADWFLQIFQPWEVEEIACVYDYFWRQYDTIFKEVAPEPPKQKANYRGEDDSHDSGIDISTEGDSRNNYLRGCISYGVGLLYKVITASTMENKRTLIKENAIYATTCLTQGLVEEPSRAVYPPSEDDVDAPAEGDELRFISDEEGPNAAWVWAHHNRVVFWYWDSKLEGFREWAYVMWDSKRLNQWGVLQADAESLAETKSRIPIDRT